MSSAEDEFTGLWRRHYPAVLRYATRRVGAELARDAAAETFAVAWRRLSSVPDESGEELAWLYAVARRVVYSQQRERSRAERVGARLRDRFGAGIPIVEPDPAERSVEKLHVLEALSRLSPRDQEALELVDWEDLSTAHAAAVAGCSVTAMGVRVHRARRRLAKQLADSPPSAQSVSQVACASPRSAR